VSVVVSPYGYDDGLIERARTIGRGQRNAYPFPETAVVLGRASAPDQELFLERCMEDGVPIYQRRTGGCAVLLDPGNVIVSVALPPVELSQIHPWFDRLTRWLIDGLRRAGFPTIRKQGAYDLAAGDRKIGGTSVSSSREAFYYTASLLVSPDLEKVERYLKHPPREPDYRSGRSHRDFMGRLDELDQRCTSAILAGRLTETLDPNTIPF
jgi:lipoate-protein ligase A